MITLDRDTVLGRNIEEAMNWCGSDKHTSHRYSEGYSYFMEKTGNSKPKTFLEIGISNQGPEMSSLHGWRRVFNDCEIFGIDIAARKMIEAEGIKTFVVDQSEPFELSQFKSDAGTKFDIILDDGSHVFEHARMSLDVLFSALSPNGLYMIEDVSKVSGMWEQSVQQWDDHLSLRNDINYEIIDCVPENPEDDSILIGIWRKSGA